MALDLEIALRTALDNHWTRAVADCGPWLACKPGCAECCVGPFPITRLDVRWLRRGLAELEATDPERAGEISARAADAVALLRPGFPGDSGTGRIAADESVLDRFFAGHAALACPALDPASGRCELYAWRPVACRTYGPPLRYGNRKTEPCRLCFVGASADEVEWARREPDPRALEERILEGLGADPDESWETLIAFALVAEEAEEEW